MIAAVWLALSTLFYSLQLQTGSFPKPLTADEERHYLTLSAQGDLEARNILIERNLRLVAHIMKKYYANTSDQEDLISIGTIGLIKGITTFDSSKGARLATYAARCVENEILMHFRAQKKTAQDVSLSDYIETGNDGAALSLMDVVSDDDDLLERLTEKETCARLRKAVAQELTDQERRVITLRYGLTGAPPQRQREVAQTTGISRSYVSHHAYCKRWENKLHTRPFIAKREFLYLYFHPSIHPSLRWQGDKPGATPIPRRAATLSPSHPTSPPQARDVLASMAFCRQMPLVRDTLRPTNDLSFPTGIVFCRTAPVKAGRLLTQSPRAERVRCSGHAQALTGPRPAESRKTRE